MSRANASTLKIGPPNIVVIVMDDLGWGDLACHGNPIVRTPNIDRLHAASTRLTRYSSGPLCTPARASLMTGRYHLRTRAIDTYRGRAMIDPDELTLPRVLQSVGYRTGGFGKWHLGDAYPMRACDLGFDTTLTHKAGGIGQPGDHRDNYSREGEAYFSPTLFRDGLPERHDGYCTDVFTEATMQFIDRAGDQPFFAYLATNAPHTPLEIDNRWADHYRDAGVNETHARLYGMIENIDWNVGRLLDRLDARGLAKSTLVVYLSDHGPCPSSRDFTAPPDRQQRFNAGLRGEKGSLYQGAILVPSFWRWSGHYQPGRDVDRVTSPIDVMPTLAAAAGASIPAETTLDGVDLNPLLRADVRSDQWPGREIYMQWHRGNVPTRYRNYAVITQGHKLYRPDPGGAGADTVPDQLFDLVTDPGESQDIAADRPDLVADLRARYDRWFDDVSATRADNYAPPRIHLGSDRENPTVLSPQDWRIDDAEADQGELAWRTPPSRCHWEVTVEAAATYDVEVRLDPVEHGEAYRSVNLRIGSRMLSASWAPLCTLYTFDAVDVPAGPAEVEAWADGSEVAALRRSATYVDVYRRS